MSLPITIEYAKTLKAKPADESKLGFGKTFTDHMFIMEYTAGRGWHDARIVPYGPISLEPSATCFHYGQETFEGMKAYRGDDGRILLFRPEENFKRLNESNVRLCIPELDVNDCMDALNKLLEVEKDWVPSAPNTSLYIRPFVIGIEEVLGVKEASRYLFMIICSPSGPYYASGLKPVKIYVETKYVRAVKGGMGFAKTGGNYAASMKAQSEAHEQDYSQVLWLDGVDRKYIEEVGAMNIFFVIDGEVVTPMLNGSILAGITRKSVLELLRNKGYKVSERRISIDEVAKAYEKGKLTECFGTGTAAVISPVGELKYDDNIMVIGGGEIGPIASMLYKTLTDIQWGREQGPAGWSVEACK